MAKTLRLLRRLRLAKALAAVARLPLSALHKEVNALKALQDVALGGDFARTLKATMLAHDCRSLSFNVKVLEDAP